MFDFLKPKKKTNYQLVSWTVFVSITVLLTSKIVQLSSALTIQILIQHPELAQYSSMVRYYLIFG